MNNMILQLELEEAEALIIKAENKLEDLFFCDEIEISLISDQKYRLNFDCLNCMIQNLI